MSNIILERISLWFIASKSDHTNQELIPHTQKSKNNVEESSLTVYNQQVWPYESETDNSTPIPIYTGLSCLHFWFTINALQVFGHDISLQHKIRQ